MKILNQNKGLEGDYPKNVISDGFDSVSKAGLRDGLVAKFTASAASPSPSPSVSAILGIKPPTLG